MQPTSQHCELMRTLLPRSLEEHLSEQEEQQVVEHLTVCESCRKALESMAGDVSAWNDIGQVLSSESSGEHSRLRATRSMLLPQQSLSAFDDEQQQYSPDVRPGDFFVDFLQPSQVRESLGRLGTIEIRQFIGQGAHGIVLKGFQEELHRLVAVKVMAPHLASVVAARKRFAREARATAAIVHPNVMPILHVDSSGQLPFLVMPYVDCESLQDRLDRDSTLPLADVLRIGLQVAHGLAAAHAQGLVHRDVKPANILLERGVERVMLTDFGLARAVDDATLTRSGLIAGTPHYMSPEQARGDAVDIRSDLFSLGSVLYAMVTGRPPFRAETTYGILRRVTDDAPRPLRELNPEIPLWFELIVLKLLQKSASDRFETAVDVAELLEDCLAHLEQPNAVPLPKTAQQLAAGRRHHSKRHHPKLSWVAWIAVGLAIIVCVAGIFYMNGTRPDNIRSDIETADNAAAPSELSGQHSANGKQQVSSATIESDSNWNDGVAQDLEQLDGQIDELTQAIRFD